MSKAGLLIQCQWAFRNDAVPRSIGNVPMRYGNGFHALTATGLEAGMPQKMPLDTFDAAIKEFALEEQADELYKHVQDAYGTLRDWLDGGNAWGMKLLPAPKGAFIVEKAIAYHTRTGKARLIGPVDENHVYSNVEKAEHPGTVDLAIDLSKYGASAKIPKRLKKSVIVADHKTGMVFDQPQDSYQLKSLALAFKGLLNAEYVIVAINHAPRDGIPTVFADELNWMDLDAHAKKLKVAFKRIGDGSLRPGNECGYCAGNSVCPAFGASLGVLSRDLKSIAEGGPQDPLVQEAYKAMGKRPSLDIETPEGIGRIHMILQMVRRVDDDWSERVRSKLRANPNMTGVRPDGKMVILKKVQRENLSMASIKRAVNASEALRIEKMLRDKGCIETQEREELRAVDDR